MPSWIGPWELLIVLAVVILIFGPKRVPQAGRSLGRGMREFKDAITGKDDDDEKQAALAVTDDSASKSKTTAK